MDKDSKKIVLLVVLISLIFMILFLLFIGGVFGFIYFVNNMIKNSPVSVMSFEMIKSNEQVKEVLGVPIERGFFVSGNSKINSAKLEYSIKGSKDSAKVFVSGEKFQGEWNLSYLKIIFNDNKKIELV